jgi:hypothetical protein
MRFWRNKWARRLGATLAVVVALIGLDSIWPKPLAIAAYRTGVYAWFAESPSYHKEIAVSLFRFAGWRNYAPAQMAMFHAHLEGEGTYRDLVRAVMWFRGAESQGYLPTLYHRSWYLYAVFDSVDFDFKVALDTVREYPENSGLSEDELRVKAKRKVFRKHIEIPLIARLAISAGDPFAAAERDDEFGWGKRLAPDELREIERRFEKIRHRKFEPLPKNTEICQKIRWTLYPVLSAGLETSLRCLEAYRREPESEAQWKAFFACAAKIRETGLIGKGLDGALYVLEQCDDALPET